MRANRGTAGAAAILLAAAMAAPANAQVINDVIAATIANQSRGDPCKNLVAFEKLPADQQESQRAYYGGKVERFWTLAKSDPKAAAKLVHGGKKGGLRDADGVVRPAGSAAMLNGVTPLSGPHVLVTLSSEGLGQASRGVWKSTDAAGREVLQTVDFKVNFWTMGSDAMVIHRIAVTDPEHAPTTPPTMCSMAKEAPPLW